MVSARANHTRSKREVAKARTLEIRGDLKHMGVHCIRCHSPRNKVLEPSGGRSQVGLREDSRRHGTHQSRLVAKEVKTCSGPELFRATPPMESLKFLLRQVAQRRENCGRHMDVTRACVDADASRDT